MNLLAAALRFALFAARAVVATSSAIGEQSKAVSLESRIPLPNVKGRDDHLSVDVKGQRLFVAVVDNHTLEVIDLKAGRVIRTITDLAEPQGVFYDASTNRLFVACALDGVTKVFDGTTFQVIATAKFPDDADNVRRDSRRQAVIVGYAGAKQLRKRESGTGGLGFLDSDGKNTGDIVIDAHPESFQLEKTGSRLFVNVPEKKEIEVVDVAKRAIVARWRLPSRTIFRWPSTKPITDCSWGVGSRPSSSCLTGKPENRSPPSRSPDQVMTCFSIRSAAGSRCSRAKALLKSSSRKITMTMSG